MSNTSKESKKDRAKVIEKILSDMFTKHKDHKKKQVGRCVYCVDCGERLYQGKL